MGSNCYTVLCVRSVKVFSMLLYFEWATSFLHFLWMVSQEVLTELADNKGDAFEEQTIPCPAL